MIVSRSASFTIAPFTTNCPCASIEIVAVLFEAAGAGGCSAFVRKPAAEPEPEPEPEPVAEPEPAAESEPAAEPAPDPAAAGTGSSGFGGAPGWVPPYTSAHTTVSMRSSA